MWRAEKNCSSKILRFIVNWKYLEKTDKIVCICNEMKDNFIIEMPEYKDKIEVIYNPFDIEKIVKNLL